MDADTAPVKFRPDVLVNRYELVSRFIDDLAHEIRNPLHSMVINLEVLRRRVAGGAIDDALERADVIGAELQRTHRMIEQLLQLLRPHRTVVEHTDVDELIADLAPLLEVRARNARRSFRHEPAGQIVDVYLRADQLKLAVLAVVDAAAALPDAAEELLLRTRADNGDICLDIELHATTDPAAATAAADGVLMRAALAAAQDLLAECQGRVEPGRTGPGEPVFAVTLRVPRSIGA